MLTNYVNPEQSDTAHYQPQIPTDSQLPTLKRPRP